MSFKNKNFRMIACEIPEFFRRIQSEVDQLTGQEPLSPKRYLQKFPLGTYGCHDFSCSVILKYTREKDGCHDLRKCKKQRFIAPIY